MKFLLPLFFIFSLSLYGQSDKLKRELRRDYQMIDSVYYLSFKDSTINHIDKLIESNKITINETRIYLLCRKAGFLEYMYIFKEETDEEHIEKSSRIILNLYDSILSESECSSTQRVKYYRYKFLSSLVYRYKKELNEELTKLYKIKKSELNLTGLKPERDGLGLGMHYTLGKEKWIAFDFSLASYFKGVTHLRSQCDGKTKFNRPSNIVVHSMNAFIFSYSRGLKSKTNDLSFSLFELNAPLTFIPLRFGVQDQLESNSKNFYYRPGFGLSIGMVSLSYSYNLMFSKSKRASSEKLLLDLRIIYPIVNYRYRTKRY